MKNTYHTVIVGTGCAGYNAADCLYRLGVTDIAIVTEGRQMGTSRNTGSDKQTYYKLSLCGDEPDSVREMAHTLYSGGGVMGEHALCEAAYSARCFMKLVELGVPFPANEYGEYLGYKTDHDPRSRATSCGPLTSKYMTQALERSVLAKKIPILDRQRVIRILTDQGRVAGLVCVHTRTGEFSAIYCQNVILCTGGPAGIYYHSVYPKAQFGGTGLAIEAGAALANMEEWQYGIASTQFRWNVSGTYQQVIPRYLSVSPDGTQREFLYEALGDRAPDLVFLKGYQWPFDTRKLAGSSQIDVLVARETEKGNRVYLDFQKNPKGLERGFSALGPEAYQYLQRSGALFGTPLERLEKMNPQAIELYKRHNIDLRSQYLQIAVCAQHCNGGVAVDENWQSTVEGLYAAGEAAGTFGVYRPGGSALNSTQVGSLRAAQHVAQKPARPCGQVPYPLPALAFGPSNVSTLRNQLQRQMSRCAAFDRDLSQMQELFDRVCQLCDGFFQTVTVKDPSEGAQAFMLYDMVLTQRSVLSAMIFSAKELGTHGSALVDGKPGKAGEAPRESRTLTCGEHSAFSPVSKLPSPELWFEALLAKQRKNYET